MAAAILEESARGLGGPAAMSKRSAFSRFRRWLSLTLVVAVAAGGLALMPAAADATPAGAPAIGATSTYQAGPMQKALAGLAKPSKLLARSRVERSALAALQSTTMTSYKDVIEASDPLMYWRLADRPEATLLADEEENWGLGRSDPLEPVRGAIPHDGNLGTVAKQNLGNSSVSGYNNPELYTSDTTTEMWFKPLPGSAQYLTAFTSTCTSLLTSTTHGQSFVAYLTDDGVVHGSASGTESSGTYSVSTPNTDPIAYGVWHMATMVRSSTDFKIYIDGVEAAQVNLGATVGGCGGLGEYAHGTILEYGNAGAMPPGYTSYGSVDEFSYYDKELSATDVYVHYAGAFLDFSNLPYRGGCGPCSLESVLNEIRAAVGGPIDVATGTMWHHFTDLSLPGRGKPASFSHYYESDRSSITGSMGYGWSSSLDMSVATVGGAQVVTEQSGSQLTFLPRGPTDPDQWAPSSAGVKANLEQTSTGWTFTRAIDDIVTFDTSGRLTGETDLNGHGYSVTYPSSTEADITADSGRTLVVTLASGKITSVTDNSLGTARTVSFSYDSNGDLISHTDAAGGVNLFAYDSNHRLTKMVTPRFASAGISAAPGTVTHYDSSGRADWQEDPLGRRISIDYSITDQRTVTDPAGRETEYDYTKGFLTAVTLAPGTSDEATWQYFYDDPTTYGPTKVIDPEGQTVETAYDLQGNVASVDDGVHSPTSMTWNADGHNELDTATDGNGVTTTYDYDSNGNLTSVSRPIKDDTGANITNGGSSAIGPAVTTYTIDSTGGREGDVTAITDPRGKTTNLTYSSGGEVTDMTDPLGHKNAFTYDGAGRLATSIAPRGYTKLNPSDPTPNPADWTSTYSYDALNRPLSTTDPLGHGSSTAYDADGNVTSTTDGNSHTTSYAYDNAGRPTVTTRPDSTTVSYSYNDSASTTTYTDGASHSTVTHYDPRGWPDSVTDPLSRVTTTSYYDNGQPHIATQPGSNSATVTYDAAGQLSGVNYSASGTPDITSLSYDGNGTMTAMTDSTGSQAWHHDSLGNLLSHTDTAGNTVSYQYDVGGLNTKLTYPGTSKVVTRAFDDAGRLTSVADWTSLTSTFAYDANDNVIQSVYGNNNTLTRTYDNADRPLTIVSAVSGTTYLSFTDTYDTGNLRTQQAKTGFNPPAINFTHNSLDQLATVTPSNGSTRTNNYDAADNPITLDHVSSSPTAQRFDAANQLCWSKYPGSTTGSCGSPPSGATTYSYDNRGNRTAKTPPTGSAVAYDYDGANRLTTVTTGSTTTASYTYDGTGMRTSKTVGSTTTTHTWDESGGLPLLLKDTKSTGTNTTYYVYGPYDQPIAVKTDGSTSYFFQPDNQGSVWGISSPSGYAGGGT